MNKNLVLPIEIQKIVDKVFGERPPSVLLTNFYLRDVLDILMENTNLLWSHSFYSDEKRILSKGLFKFTDTNTLIFFDKKDNENIYRFYILSEEKKIDSMIFYFNKFSKYKTI